MTTLSQVLPKGDTIKVRFIRPVFKLTKEELSKLVYQQIEGIMQPKYIPHLMQAVMNDPKHFYNPGEVYEIGMKQAQRYLSMGIKIKHINNDIAKTPEQVVFKADALDSRVETHYKVAVKVTDDEAAQIEKSKKEQLKKVDKAVKKAKEM